LNVLAADARFGAIAFHDVFEHLPEVNRIVETLAAHLEPGGVVIVNLPMADGLIFRIARLTARLGVTGPLDRMWQRDLASPHLSYFTAATLERLFNSAKFTLVRRGRLRAIVTTGLYDRIRYYRGIGPASAMALYIAARIVGFMTGMFRSDIQYFVFRRPAG
jgi:hypothetical protein